MSLAARPGVNRIVSWFVFGTIVVGVLAVARSARADLAACIGASEQGLSLRRAGHLREAREQLAVCTVPACPEELRADCAKRMESVNAAMPSLVLGAKDASGTDLLEADVGIDGVVVAHVLDGRPIELDPGEHVVKITAPGLPTAERKLVVGEGDKHRREAFIVGEIASVPGPGEPAKRPWGTRQTLAVVGVGIGVVGIGVGTAAGLLAGSEWRSEQNATTAQKGCASSGACPAHNTAVQDHDTTVTYATVSTVGFVAGGALVAADRSGHARRGGAQTFIVSSPPAP